MTSQGSPYSQFKRAIGRGNLLVAWGLAAELPKVPLADALALLLLARDQEPWRYHRAAPRWHARLCSEHQLPLDDAQLALAALNLMAGPRAPAGALALHALCELHGLDDEAGQLDRWLDTQEKRI